MTYTVIYEKGPRSWGAYVPDLPGVLIPRVHVGSPGQQQFRHRYPFTLRYLFFPRVHRRPM